MKRGHVSPQPPLRSLSELPPGEVAEVVELTAEGGQRRHLLDLGLVPGTPVAAVRRSASGEPTAYAIRGALVALRSEDTARVRVRHRAGGEQ
ncbi:MAG: ferrous iron transport protein A [Terriglobia bacterium]